MKRAIGAAVVTLTTTVSPQATASADCRVDHAVATTSFSPNDIACNADDEVARTTNADRLAAFIPTLPLRW